MDKKTSFRKKIREKRIEIEFTQKEVADMLGISTSFYTQIELGTRNPRLEVAIKLCKLLNLEIKDWR